LAGTLVSAAVPDLTEDGDCLDRVYDWEFGYSTRRTQRPYGAEAGKPGSKAGLEAFADRQTQGYVFIMINLDSCLFCSAEHSAINLTALAIKKRPVQPTGRIGVDVPEECDHAADNHASVLQGRMKPDNVTGDVIRQGEAP
jgi:hypothetical protein